MYDVSLKRKWDAEAVRQYQEQQLSEAIQKSLETGIEQGIEQGAEAKSYEVVENLIHELKLTDDVIVRVAGVSLDFVQQVRADLASDKK